MKPYHPDAILVHVDAWHDEFTHEILGRVTGVPVATIKEPGEAIVALSCSPDPLSRGNTVLMLTRNLGQFMKPCPGSGAQICCNYQVLNVGSNCHLECTYCILQSYLDNPALMIFTNVGDLIAEVTGKLGRSPSRIFRVGTGELVDSLALDDITHYSQRLVPLFAALPNGVLELKTKSDQISNLEGLDHRGHTVVSWSVNARALCLSEEPKSASLEERLAAARQCQQWGYRIGFHFDPLIWYEGWEGGYKEAVKEIFSAVDPAGIAWVSLGALRFTPHLKEIVRRRFPKSKIPHGEFVPGHHGKLRYFRPIREEMYSRLSSWIREVAPGVFVYLCMEDRTAWLRGMGRAPRDTSELSGWMDSLVRIAES
jgi:spore photoproduct lyase